MRSSAFFYSDIFLFLIATQLKVMQQQNLKPYNSTLATVSAYCSKAFQVDLAEHLLDQVSECSYAYPFNNLLAACDSLVSYSRYLCLPFNVSLFWYMS